MLRVGSVQSERAVVLLLDRMASSDMPPSLSVRIGLSVSGWADVLQESRVPTLSSRIGMLEEKTQVDWLLDYESSYAERCISWSRSQIPS